MAYLLLKNHLLWKDACELARQVPNCIVSIQQLKKPREIIPITGRATIKAFHYNYFPNNTYRRTHIADKNGNEVRSYAVYQAVPDQIHYFDLLMFIRQNLQPLRGHFRSFVQYRTAEGIRFSYSLENAVVQFDVDMAFVASNPVMIFESGTAKERTYDADRYRRIKARQEAGRIGTPGRPKRGDTAIAEATAAARAIKRKKGRPKTDPNAPPFIMPCIPQYVIDEDGD